MGEVLRGEELRAADEERKTSKKKSEEEGPGVVRRHSSVSVLGTHRANRRAKTRRRGKNGQGW